MWRETRTDGATVQRLWGPRGRKAAARAGQRMQPGPCARHGGGRADAGDLAAIGPAAGRASGAGERRARAAGELASVLALAKTRVCFGGRRPPLRI